MTRFNEKPDAASPAGGDGTLPGWDLSDLYPAPDSPELAGELDLAAKSAGEFAAAYRGKVATLDAKTLASAIAAYERIDEALAKAVSYAGLVYAGDNEDPEIGRFYQGISERANAISSDLIFFTLELNRIEEFDLRSKLADPGLAHYAPWLRTVLLFRPHQLSDEVERLLHERHIVGAGAWSRLFDQTIAAMRFPISGEDLPISDALNLLSDSDRARRKAAAEAIGAEFGRQIRTYALITSTLAKDKQIDDAWRSYKRPVSYRNLSNQVEDEVVDALASAVKDAYPTLSHRYYRLKARWLNGPDPTVLDYYDRNAPLPGDPDRHYSWGEARDLVLEAYGRFSPELATVGRRFFDRPWIDAPVRPGKQSGAFAHPTVPSAHPYLLLNYHGKADDVMTLAHELGHGVHQVLAGKQGHLMSATPLTLAETASVFGEMLTFQALLARAGNADERRFLLAGKVEDMLNTVVRQIAFFDFETRVHAARKDEGELTPERLGEIWLAVQRESLGPALRFDADYRHYWAYIPHFIHTPFYVYAYAFGDCLVNALYAVYRTGEADFPARYLEMLAAGGTKTHRELLAPFGLDAADPGFWRKGLGLIGGLIDELERLG